MASRGDRLSCMDNTRRSVHRVSPEVSREAKGGEERDERFKELDRLIEREDDQKPVAPADLADTTHC